MESKLSVRELINQFESVSKTQNVVPVLRQKPSKKPSTSIKNYYVIPNNLKRISGDRDNLNKSDSSNNNNNNNNNANKVVEKNCDSSNDSDVNEACSTVLKNEQATIGKKKENSELNELIDAEIKPVSFSWWLKGVKHELITDWFGKNIISNEGSDLLETYNHSLSESHICSACNHTLIVRITKANAQEEDTEKEKKEKEEVAEEEEYNGGSHDDDKEEMLQKEVGESSVKLLNMAEVADKENQNASNKDWDIMIIDDTEVQLRRSSKYDSGISDVTIDYPFSPNSTQNHAEIETKASNENLNEFSEKQLYKIKRIIKKLIDTEKNYNDVLQSIITDYMDHFDQIDVPSHLLGRSPYLFANIKKIYAFTSKFYQELQESDFDLNKVVDVFIANKSLFEQYPMYFKNKPKADEYLEDDFYDILEERREKLGQTFDLASNLMVPIQRITKYVLLLENMQKELKKMNSDSTKLQDAVNMLKAELQKGNDFLAIYSIKSFPQIDTVQLGSFVARESFLIKSGKKFVSMVFLFDHMLIFTSIDPGEHFVFKFSLRLSEISLVIMDYEPVEFQIIRYAKKSKRKKSESIFVLEAKTPEIKATWTTYIYNMLSVQFLQCKEQQKMLHAQEGKRWTALSLKFQPQN